MNAIIENRPRALPAVWPRPVETSFQVVWAHSADEVAQAQRLRFRIFHDEMGAHLPLDSAAVPGHDIDRYDAHCEHLLIRARSGAQHGQVVATCRLLTPAGAAAAGGRYTDGEFDLDPIRNRLSTTIEMGRVCIHPDWRNGMLVMAMWKAVGEQMALQKFDSMIGCTSVSAADGGELARQLWWQLSATHLVPAPLQIRPRMALALGSRAGLPRVAIPTLMKGYLRCGGRLLGPPALDRDFNTADFPMLVNLADLPSRYVKRVLASKA